MRGTPRFIAGSRFKYTPDKIDFTYDNLVSAIGEAIDKQAEEDSGKFVTEKRTDAYKIKPEKNFEEVMSELKILTAKIRSATGADFKTKWAPKIVAITDKYLGTGKKVNDCTEAQMEQLELILLDLKELVANGL